MFNHVNTLLSSSIYHTSQVPQVLQVQTAPKMYTKKLPKHQEEKLILMLNSGEEKNLALFNALAKSQGFSSRLVKRLVDSAGKVQAKEWFEWIIQAFAQ